MSNLNVRVHYPRNPDYTLETRLVKIDIEKEARYNIATNRGFRITTHDNTIKKALKSETTIYSPKFGESEYSENPFTHRYQCECGRITGTTYENTICDKCNKPVKYIGDDFTYFGYIIIDNYKIIHPIVFRQLKSFIGQNVLESIINLDLEKDEDGNVIKSEPTKKEPFKGIGLIAFRDRIHEVLEFYRNKNKSNPKKIAIYNDIVKSFDIIFTDTIPVYTIHLRPVKITGGHFDYDKINEHYTIISKNVTNLNKNVYDRTNERADRSLYVIQAEYDKLYQSIINTLAQKHGEFRGLFGGRYNFTARAVIKPRPSRIDEIELPYAALTELLKFDIINVMDKSYNISPNKAVMMWNTANSEPASNERGIVKNIINNIIKNSGRGIPVLLNRNPTIEFGSIEQFYVNSMNEEYSIGIPLQILGLFAADFDGDQENVMRIISKEFLEAAENIFNPRNALYISHEDGYVNDTVIHNKDLLVNINSLKNMCTYTPEQLSAIEDCLKETI
jgi:DNA-directed RNA polymerase beta' subunit